MIKGSRLGFSYFWDGESIPVFEQANIELKEGEWTAILGCNGCGKSTLVRLMNGLLPLQNGNLSVNGINAGNPANKWELCRICGMVFQNPDNQFVSSVLEEDIAFGLENAQVPEREVTSKVKAALELVGLEGYEKRSPSSLSGGQKQRAALAGVLALNPEILIFDDSFSALDFKTDAALRRALKTYTGGSTVLLVTHSMDDAARIADRLVVFHEGGIAMDGTPDEVFSRPAELTSMGLDVPQAAAIAQALRERGVELPGSIYTLEQLRAALVPLRKGGRADA